MFVCFLLPISTSCFWSYRDKNFNLAGIMSSKDVAMLDRLLEKPEALDLVSTAVISVLKHLALAFIICRRWNKLPSCLNCWVLFSVICFILFGLSVIWSKPNFYQWISQSCQGPLCVCILAPFSTLCSLLCSSQLTESIQYKIDGSTVLFQLLKSQHPRASRTLYNMRVF